MNCSKWLLGIAVEVVLGSAGVCNAEDLGVIGPLYAIAEEDGLAALLRRLRELEGKGELQHIRTAAINRSLSSIKAPPPVTGIATVRAPSRRLLDPTVLYPRAISNELGQVVVPAGARINPLLVTTLSRKLLFFDGRDRQQAAAVRRVLARQGNRIKPVLVAGSWYDISRAWKVQVYFDQQGRLCQRFGIVAVPSLVSQEGERLLVEEIPAGALR